MIQEQKCYTSCTGMSAIYMNRQFHKRMELRNAKDLSVICMQGKLCCRLKVFNAGLGLQTDTRKCE